MGDSQSITGGVMELAPVFDALRREVENLVIRVSEIAVSDPKAQHSSFTARDIGKTRASQFARQMLKERRERDNIFGADLFGEPAWDMLLDLFVATEEGRKVSVSSLCIAAAVPSTTALRWIGNLTQRGIILRTPDPRDGRRVFLEMSPEVHEAMSRLLASWMEPQHLLRSV